MYPTTLYPTVAHIVADPDDENVPTIVPRWHRPIASTARGRLSGARELQRVNIRRRFVAGWAVLDPAIGRAMRGIGGTPKPRRRTAPLRAALATVAFLALVAVAAYIAPADAPSSPHAESRATTATGMADSR